VTIPAWIAVGIVAFSIVLLLVVLLGLRRRLRPLAAATMRLNEQASQVEELQKRLEELQPKVDEVTAKIEQVQAKLPHR
jgi:peptidoglycan hydrolase CwlO-like protein